MVNIMLKKLYCYKMILKSIIKDIILNCYYMQFKTRNYIDLWIFNCFNDISSLKKPINKNYTFYLNKDCMNKGSNFNFSGITNYPYELYYKIYLYFIIYTYNYRIYQLNYQSIFIYS